MLPLPPASTGAPGERRVTGETRRLLGYITLGLRVGIRIPPGVMRLPTREDQTGPEGIRVAGVGLLAFWDQVAPGVMQVPLGQRVRGMDLGVGVGGEPTAPVVLGLGVTVLWSGSDNA